MRPLFAILVTAILLRLTAIGPGAVGLVGGLVPAFFVLYGRPTRDWALAGVVIGAVYSGTILVALAKWGPGVTVGLWFAVTLGFAAFFASVGWVASRARPSVRPGAVAGAWASLVFILDRWVYPPVFLSAPLAQESAMYRRLVAAVGAPGAEGLVVLTAMGIAAMLHRQRWAKGALIPLPLALALAAALPAPQSIGSGVLHAVRPSFTWRDYLSKGSSLEARNHLVHRTMQLTTAATRREAGTILWPENGTGLSEAQLPWRQKELRKLLASSKSDLVTAGPSYEDGGTWVSAVHMNAEGPQAVTQKAHLVPFAEAGTSAGATRVLETVAGRLGLSVCFDGLFGPHVRELVNDGAELWAVTSDHASFGPSMVTLWHQNHVILRAAELQRSVLFFGNHGPVAAYDAVDNRIVYSEDKRRPEVTTVTLSRIATAPNTGMHEAVALLWALLTLGLVVRGKAHKTLSFVLRPVPTVVWAFSLGLLAEWGHIAWHRNMSVEAVVSEMIARQSGLRQIDALSGQFAQSQPNSCGRAALAYALTLLGDDVFEERLADLIPLQGTGSSLFDLATAAKARGFVAASMQADGLKAVPPQPGVLYILHLSQGHFVVLMGHEDHRYVFDPATGRTQFVSSEAVASMWTGYALRVSHRSLDDILNDPPASSPPQGVTLNHVRRSLKLKMVADGANGGVLRCPNHLRTMVCADPNFGAD